MNPDTANMDELLATYTKVTGMAIWLEEEANDAAWRGTSIPAHFAEAAMKVRYIQQWLDDFITGRQQ